MWDPRLESTYDLVFQVLSDPDPETRIQAGEILVRTPRDPRALADLVELAGPTTPDKNTRTMALMAIARVPEEAFDALDRLRGSLQHLVPPSSRLSVVPRADVPFGSPRGIPGELGPGIARSMIRS